MRLSFRVPVKFPFQPRHRFVLGILAVSLLVGGRWYIANQEPIYPMGEGVYRANNTPAWGEMTHPNAATFYMAAADAFPLNEYFRLLDARPDPKAYIGDDTPAVQKPIVQMAQPAFALLRQGMRYSYVPGYPTNYFNSKPGNGEGIQRTLPNFVPIREFCRLFAAEANIKESEGDPFGALNSSLDAMRLGSDIGQEPTLLEGMVGILGKTIGFHEARRHISLLSAKQARAGIARLEPIRQQEWTMAELMTADRDTITYGTLKEVFRTGNLVGQSPNTAEVFACTGDKWRFVFGAMVFVYTKQGLVNDFASAQDKMIARVKLPYQQAKSLPPTAPSANPLVRYWTYADFFRAYSHLTMVSTQNRVLLTQLAVQAYRGEHCGMAPTSLVLLTRGTKPYLSAIPTDPYSLSGTAPLRYNARTGNVYSIGTNAIDDNGSDDGNNTDDISGVSIKRH